MKRNRGNQYAVIAAAAVAAIAAHAQAADVIWQDANPPSSNWSDVTNWSTGALPGGADNAIFSTVGAVGAAGTVTNVVDANHTVDSLRVNIRSDQSLFHTTQINDGVTLTTDASGQAVFIGTGTDEGITAEVHYTVTGPGTLNVNNAAGVFMVRQGSGTGGSTGNPFLARATMDMSTLANFTATVDDFHVGQGTASATPPGNRGTGTVRLALNNTINADDELVVGAGVANGGGQSQLFLGGNATGGGSNNLNIAEITVGGRKGNGLVAFNTGIVNGNVLIRGFGGGSNRADLLVGAAQASEATSNGSQGIIDFTAGSTFGSGSVDALLGNVIVGRSTASTGNGTGRLTYDAGTINANSITLGVSGTAGTTTGVGSGTLEVKGGAALIVNNNVTLASNSGGASAPLGNLTISGTDAVTRATATIGGDLLDAGGTSTVVVTNGSLTAQRMGSAANPIDSLAVTDGTIGVLFDTATPTAHVTTLNVAGDSKLSLGVSGNVTPGLYPVIDYGTVAGALTLGKLPPRMSATLIDSGSTLDLNVTSFDSPKWIGNVNSNWDTATSNWQLINSGVATTYEENLAVYSSADNVLFDNSATTGNVTVATNVAPGSIRFENTAALPYHFTGSGAIGGATPITKNGDGSVTIANSGGNNIGSVAINGGTFRIGDNSTSGGGLGTYGSIANAGTLELSPAAGDALSVAGVISGAGAVKHTGAGRTTLGAGNTYTGATDITAGTVVVTGNNTFGPIGSGSAAVNVSGTGAIDLAGVAGTNALDFTTNKIFNIAGDGPDGTGAIVNSGAVGQQNAFEKINLTADASVGGAARFDVRGTDAVRGMLNLANQTLTKKGAGSFNIVRSDVTDGNINVEAGTLRFETSTNVEGSGLVSVAPGAMLQFFSNSGTISRPIAINSAIVNDANQAPAATIQSPIAMTGDNTFDLTASNGLTFAGVVSGAGGMTKTGGGTMALSGANTFTGKLAASDGRLDLLSSQVGSSSLEASGDARIVLANDGSFNKVIRTGLVAVTETAQIDLKNNKLITAQSTGNAVDGVYTGLQGEIQRAYNFGSWDGFGLTTSEERAGQNAGVFSGTTTIGVNTAQAVLFMENPTDTGVWAGQTVTGTDALAMYTYAGDMNFDGLVDGADYGIIDNSVQFPGTDGYMNGDLNYDGVIDGADYGIIDNTIQLQGDPIPAGTAFASAASLAGVTAVPEPASLSVVAVAAAALLGRRRRRTHAQ